MIATVNHLMKSVDMLLDRIAAVARSASGAIDEKADKVKLVALTIPTEGWKNDGTAEYPNYIDIAIKGLTADDCVCMTIPREGGATALAAGVLGCTESREGVLRLRAKKVPAAAIPASYYIVK